MKPFLLAAAVLLAAPAMAQEVAEADREALAARVAEFDQAMRSGDMAGTVAFMPDRVKGAIAAGAGVTEAELEEAMAARIEAVMQGVTIDDFGMDVGAATLHETPDGSRAYALIPTVTVMTAEGAGQVRAASQTLALQDEGEWYLLRIDDPSQVSVLQAAYPEFAGVAFEPGTVEPVQ